MVDYIPPRNASSGQNEAHKKRRQRVRIALLLAVFLILTIFVGQWLFTATVVLVFIQCFRELLDIFKAKGIQPSPTAVLLTGVVLILLAHFGKSAYFMPVITLGFIGGFLRLLFRKPLATINDIGGTFLALLYVAFMPMHFILLRNLALQPGLDPWVQPGAYYVFCTCLVIAMSDVGAYYGGKLYGRRLLYPEISPKKTREGALIGGVVGILFGLSFMAAHQFDLGHALVLSALLVVVAQLGDLAESLMKRDAGVKDSGGLLLGHGGLLDRTDSYLFCGAISYYYIHWAVLKEGLIPDLFPMLIH